MNKHIAAGALSIGLITGCSTTFIDEIMPEANYDEMYLRGVFTWWEADENYRLQAEGGKVFSSSAKLIADGQPYDFKFADENYTPGTSCGSPLGIQNMDITLDATVIADCDNPQGNFKFTPEVTGTYRFTLDVTDKLAPRVTITKAD